MDREENSSLIEPGVPLMPDGIYRTLQRRGLCPSLVHFSRDWCAMSPNYFHTLRGRPQARPSERSYLHCWWRLMENGQHDLAGIVYGEIMHQLGRSGDRQERHKQCV